MILDRFRLTDRVVIITGGGRGIGAAIAVAFAEAGADVVIAARTVDQLETVAAAVRSVGRQALAIPADVSDLDTLPGLVAATVEKFGRIDVVINNAGGTAPRAYLDTSAGALERSFHFNVTTAFVLSKAATPYLLDAEGGSIVNIGSAMGRLTDRGFVAYGTAKAALAHMTRLLASDLAPRVRVNAIAVGSVATSALEGVLDADLRSRMEAATPLRRLGAAEDIAAAALWLASPAGSFVTGKVVEVDGGIEAPNLALGLPDL
jgi:7-alpha-hydroxysteroid dehydrogenase